VVHESLNYVLTIIEKDNKHSLLKGGRAIAQPKWHFMESKSSIRASNGGFLLVTWMDGNLKKSRISIEITKE